ncbi:MAG: 2Fe-2S iron-sulfur cluster binding domain-containing protein [Alphaproteobacteria bacterium]|nr:MAG: 2Fe-2S iron-sulfur cluster binding domain-containing protein [Alphaproteobacteria bacterium]
MNDDSKVKVTFVFPDESEQECEADIGDTLLHVIRNNDIPIPCSCGGALSCSTCHVILDKSTFDLLESKGDIATDDEEDLLDFASGRRDTSRLGCQVKISPDMQKVKVIIPK